MGGPEACGQEEGTVALLYRGHEVPVAHHKFKVGQFVDYRPGRLSGALLASSRYKILRLLPAEGSDLLYRIKSADETFERVAKEHELAQRSE
jgi:hypothetical protein